MKWLNNLISYCKTGEMGKCPECKSSEIEVTEHINGERKSLTFHCEHCGASNHFDGVVNSK